MIIKNAAGNSKIKSKSLKSILLNINPIPMVNKMMGL
jgi:hypothetical protein